MQIHSEVRGTGPPVVILHGLFGSSDNWQKVSRRLAARFRVFTVDQRNHGQSPHAEKMDYGLLAGDVLELLDRNSQDAAALIGHSMGGKTAMQVALTAPARVMRLVVVDVAPRAYEPVHNGIFRALRALDLARYRSRLEVEQSLAAEIPDLAVRHFLLKNLRLDTDGRLAWKIDLEAIWNNYSHLNEAIMDAAPVDLPALFLRGARSDYVRPEDESEIRRLFPRAQFKVIEGAGHWLHTEAAAEFLAAVEDFLRPLLSA